MSHWLMKSEPDVFGIDDLAKAPRKTTHWDGVRNYQARNFMRDLMKVGDEAFFYHSNCAEPGIAGIVTIAKTGYPDHTALDPKDPHYDPQSDPDNPRWYMVDVRFKRRFKRVITLEELKKHGQNALAGMQVLQRGNRLSITPVSDEHWSFILDLE